MKNANWRRAAIIMAVLIAGMVSFGIGYSIGAFDTAKHIITIAVEVLEIEDVSVVELFHQYRRLKGGG